MACSSCGKKTTIKPSVNKTVVVKTVNLPKANSVVIKK